MLMAAIDSCSKSPKMLTLWVIERQSMNQIACTYMQIWYSNILLGALGFQTPKCSVLLNKVYSQTLPKTV